VSGETLSTLVLAIVIGVPVIIVVLLLAWPERLRSQEKNAVGNGSILYENIGENTVKTPLPR
jgi:hypothetical protein